MALVEVDGGDGTLGDALGGEFEFLISNRLAYIRLKSNETYKLTS